MMEVDEENIYAVTNMYMRMYVVGRYVLRRISTVLKRVDSSIEGV